MFTVFHSNGRIVRKINFYHRTRKNAGKKWWHGATLQMESISPKTASWTLSGKVYLHSCWQNGIHSFNEYHKLVQQHFALPFACALCFWLICTILEFWHDVMQQCKHSFETCLLLECAKYSKGNSENSHLKYINGNVSEFAQQLENWQTCLRFLTNTDFESCTGKID